MRVFFSGRHGGSPQAGPKVAAILPVVHSEIGELKPAVWAVRNK